MTKFNSKTNKKNILNMVKPKRYKFLYLLKIDDNKIKLGETKELYLNLDEIEKYIYICKVGKKNKYSKYAGYLINMLLNFHNYFININDSDKYLTYVNNAKTLRNYILKNKYLTSKLVVKLIKLINYIFPILGYKIKTITKNQITNKNKFSDDLKWDHNVNKIPVNFKENKLLQSDYDIYCNNYDEDDLDYVLDNISEL
ncbi:hypothetical protein CPAV1605_506 [seawater metagenome]|uniref:Uncharacterized protein n=1 Tax=seawater metagenome TaxID=1561972 RepID=A0A5E8CHR4_9ZZZZ